MEKPFEIITRENREVSALVGGKELTLREAVGLTAFSVYEKLIQVSGEENADERRRLEEKIVFQSRVLDSLSNAYSAIK